MPEWISVKDRLPEIYEDCDNDEEIRVDVTHWMMLPDPPKEDIGE